MLIVVTKDGAKSLSFPYYNFRLRLNGVVVLRWCGFLHVLYGFPNITLRKNPNILAMCD
jgi:hypothetical protein